MDHVSGRGRGQLGRSESSNDTGTANKMLNRFSNLGHNFRLFWLGQTISNIGSSFSAFAFPLLVYKLTGSALHLALSSAASFVPYIVVGLFLGAWADRVDRRRLMIALDVARAFVVVMVPLLNLFGALQVWFIYAVIFALGFLGIPYQAAQFAALPAIVERDHLATANGQLQASLHGSRLVGPLLAGALVFIAPVTAVFLVDAASFLASALMLRMVHGEFNPTRPSGPPRGLWGDVVEGVRYVFSDPVLRSISIVAAASNFFGITVWAQLVLFAKDSYEASDLEVGMLFASQGLGIILLSLAAGPLHKRYSFRTLTLGALALRGALLMAFALVPSLWLGLPIWAIASGLTILFVVQTTTLRQTVVPNEMLGRVGTVGTVLAWSTNPLGALFGGWLIYVTGNVELVYFSIGAVIALIAGVATLGPLGRRDVLASVPDPVTAGAARSRP